MESNIIRPKKILRITDLTFTLPDDFNGDVQEALNCVVDYLSKQRELKQVNDGKSTVESVFTKSPSNNRLGMIYGIFECDKDGNYILK